MRQDQQRAGAQSGAHRRPFHSLTLLILGLGVVLAAGPALADIAVVADDNNNVRARGGSQYRTAPVLLVLNQGDYVRVWKREGNWAQVSTPEDVNGWVNAKCLKPAPSRLQPEALPPDLRTELAGFLKRLQAAVQTRQFSQLAPLLDPEGVYIEGRFFSDAGQDPARQKPQVVHLWYATDVSATLGTAWELLMTGTNPPPVTLGLDPATDWLRVLQPGEKSSAMVPAEKSGPVLPEHLQALALAPQAALVQGFAEQLEGVPEPQEYTENNQVIPFSWVYQVGRDRYRLEQIKRIGLILVITNRPGQGLRLRSVSTQAP